MIKTGKISASMMCTNLTNLTEVIRVLEEEQVDYLHIDVMDGVFVPNLGLGVDYIRGLRELTSIPLELHLMIDRPEDKLSWFHIRETDRVIIHFESTVQLQRTLEKVRAWNCKVILAINPATPIYSVEEVLTYIDGITVLTVNPGFAGQKIVHSCIDKTRRLHAFLEAAGFGQLEIEVDGNISCENARLLRGYGAGLFVAGTSSIFSADDILLRDKIRSLKAVIR